MKRYGYLFEKAFSKENISLAIQKASKGKKDRINVMKILADKDKYVDKIYDLVWSGKYVPAPYTHAKIKDGISKKEREEYRELLKKLDLGLEDRLTSKVGLLSGGQRQALTLLMATLQKPKMLLLDEHTAALDPKTAAKVLSLSDSLIKENNLMTMMVTHNMHDAIVYGNRLIMMHEGRIILDISGEEKKNLTVDMLLHKFEEVSGSEFVNDRALLSK